MLNPPNLQQCITKIETANISYEWKIENFSLHNMKTGELFISPTITALENDDLKWIIKIYPNGEEEKVKEYISLYLQAETEKSNHKVQMEFSIMNKDKIKVHKKSGEATYDVKKKSCGYRSFIESKLLFKNKASLLPNDTLTICCDFSVGLNNQTFATTKTNGSKRFKFDDKSKEQKQICKDLDNLLNKEEFTDILLTTNTNQFKAHKNILAARSPVFQAMFSNNMLEKLQNEIKIIDFDCEIVSEMLKFIYTGTVKNIEKNAMSLLRIADKYDIKGLKNMCENFLNDSISIENTIDLLILADHHNIQDFKTKVIKFFLAHKKEIAKTPKFDDLKVTHANLIVDLFCNEC